MAKRLTFLLVYVLGSLGTTAAFKLSPLSGRAPSALQASQVEASAPLNLDNLFKVGQRLTSTIAQQLQTPERIQYAGAMGARFSYFLLQGIGISLFGLDPAQKKSGVGIDPTAVTGALVDAILTDEIDPLNYEVKLAESFEEKSILDGTEQRALFNKNFQGIAMLLRNDLKNIEEGKYKMPYDLNVQLAPKQWTPAPVIRQLASYLDDRKAVFDRRDRKDGLEVRKTFKSTKYPNYYLQNFHYQSDGWLSRKSARLYDYQVESLFLGTADAMRRQVMPYVQDYFTSLKSSGTDESDIRVLDVATGTGRFASHLMHNFNTIQLSALDLSPFYLAEAKDMMKQYDTVTYLEAAAEDIPADDNSFDAITCVYLFHELPAEVRVKVMKEFNRVLKPGGKLFFVDSAQEGEVPYDRVLEGFTISAHEPYYLEYTKSDLSKLFEDEGFTVDAKEVHWVSKLVVGTKQ
jgi:ubiquinone/menaquinone biosynthesis C-methylase UbiE